MQVEVDRKAGGHQAATTTTQSADRQNGGYSQKPVQPQQQRNTSVPVPQSLPALNGKKVGQQGNFPSPQTNYKQTPAAPQPPPAPAFRQPPSQPAYSHQQPSLPPLNLPPPSSNRSSIASPPPSQPPRSNNQPSSAINLRSTNRSPTPGQLQFQLAQLRNQGQLSRQNSEQLSRQNSAGSLSRSSSITNGRETPSSFR